MRLIMKRSFASLTLMSMCDTFCEWHWEAVSRWLTPVALKQMLLSKDLASLEYFARVKSTVMYHMFQTLQDQYFRRVKCEDPLLLFDQLLVQGGFVPRNNHPELPSVDRFGYMHGTLFEETALPSIDVMRLFWRKMLIGVTSHHRESIDAWCQAIIQTLPGNWRRCSKCRWQVPETGMHSHEECTYCSVVRRKGELQCVRGNVFITYPRAAFVPKTDSSSDELVEKLRKCLISCDCGAANHEQNICTLTLALDSMRL